MQNQTYSLIGLDYDKILCEIKMVVVMWCRLVLSEDQVDLWVVHRGGFIIDLLAGFALTCQSTRVVGAVFVTMFHAMNSFIFSIGQSPSPLHLRSEGCIVSVLSVCVSGCLSVCPSA